ncbi:hypothetical protein SBRY_10426 [Actinacidiphila bryophytorum]|uniref:Uncharacterized protein n=1 Tax=Actinacidiphila bryophytorum TaxID=1436133 RepID=A0A9W4GWS7_9ACTN|nr:hypothetical protein SBRY_10426 [Actinacidiphila bryophytorum]
MTAAPTRVHAPPTRYSAHRLAPAGILAPNGSPPAINQMTQYAASSHVAPRDAHARSTSLAVVDTTHPRVEALYEAWGYRRVGTQRPFADSPLYAVMVAELPLTS